MQRRWLLVPLVLAVLCAIGWVWLEAGSGQRSGVGDATGLSGALERPGADQRSDAAAPPPLRPKRAALLEAPQPGRPPGVPSRDSATAELEESAAPGSLLVVGHVLLEDDRSPLPSDDAVVRIHDGYAEDSQGRFLGEA